MNVRIISIAIALICAFAVRPALADTTTTNITEGQMTGTQTVTTSKDANGNTTTTTTKDVSGPSGPGGMEGVKYGESHTSVTEVRDGNGRVISRTEDSDSKYYDGKGGKLLIHNTFHETDVANLQTGIRTVESTRTKDVTTTGYSSTQKIKKEYILGNPFKGAAAFIWNLLSGTDVFTEKKSKDEQPKTKTRDIMPGTGKNGPWKDVTLTVDPIATSEVGTVQTVRVHVHGLSTGNMLFEVSGAAQLLNGQSSVTVPVKDGIAEVQIRGTSKGAAAVKYQFIP
jgi:hypothetical protein